MNEYVIFSANEKGESHFVINHIYQNKKEAYIDMTREAKKRYESMIEEEWKRYKTFYYSENNINPNTKLGFNEICKAINYININYSSENFTAEIENSKRDEFIFYSIDTIQTK